MRGSPPNRSALIAGNSDTGSAKKVAFTSARNAPHSTGVRRMNDSPSSGQREPGPARPGPASVPLPPSPPRPRPAADAGGRAAGPRPTAPPRRRSRPPGSSRARRSTPVITPASAGPAISTTWKTIRFSAIAAPSWSPGTSRGMNVCRAGRVDRAERRVRRDQRVQRPQGGAAEGRQAEQHRRHQRLARGRRQHQAPPVDPVGQRPAGQGDQQQRDERGQPEAADRRRRPGQVVHLEADRERGHRRAGARDSMVPSQSRRKAGYSRSGVMSVSSRTADSVTVLI